MSEQINPPVTHAVQKRAQTGSICVFASGSDEVPTEFHDEALRLGQLIGESNMNLVYGGTPVGLMGDTALNARVAGATVTGVIPTSADRYFDASLKGLVELVNHRTIGTTSLEQRKYRMLHMSDAVIALAGGIGTLDEIATTLEVGRRSKTLKSASRLVLVNTLGFYDGLKLTLDQMFVHGTTSVSSEQQLFVADNVDEAMQHVLSLVRKPRRRKKS